MTAVDVDAIAAGIVARLGLDAAPPTLAHLSELIIDWSTARDQDRTGPDWLFENVLARGRGHALFAPHKVGKSLFMLWLAVTIATGPLPVAVLYLDYEMTLDDVLERLEDMGYGPGTDLSRLAYWLLPTLPHLNTAAGADRLEELVDQLAEQHPGHELAVIIDTTSAGRHRRREPGRHLSGVLRARRHPPQASRRHLRPPRPRREGPRQRPTRLVGQGRRHRPVLEAHPHRHRHHLAP